MLPMAHVSAAYLISQIPVKGKPLTWKEVLLVILAGVIFDFDIFLPEWLGYPFGSHHLLFTHTPAMGLIYFAVFWLIFRKRVNPKIWLLVGLALLSHLVLDDLSYWLYLWEYENGSPSPQIFWLYPFDPRQQAVTKKFLELYGNVAKYKGWNDILQAFSLRMAKLFWMELGLRIATITVFVKKNWKRR
ncbi:MAG: metal-dependent hydrolase [Candidatus Shapirobacteria bacterium]